MVKSGSEVREELAEFLVNRTWDGKLVTPGEVARVELRIVDDSLVADIAATFHGEPDAPAQPPGITDRLWEYEVVEVFLLAPDREYIELEFGPHGHYLALRLSGCRNIVEDGIPMEYQATVSDRRWQGRAKLPAARLPPNVRWGNAFAIHGSGNDRRYLAAHPVGGDRPDFHRLERFPGISL